MNFIKYSANGEFIISSGAFTMCGLKEMDDVLTLQTLHKALVVHKLEGESFEDTIRMLQDLVKYVRCVLYDVADQMSLEEENKRHHDNSRVASLTKITYRASDDLDELWKLVHVEGDVNA